MMTDEVRLDKIKGFKPTEATACCKFVNSLSIFASRITERKRIKKNWQQNYAGVRKP